MTRYNGPQLLIPSINEAFFYYAISGLILLLINFDRIISSFGLSISIIDLPDTMATFYVNVLSEIFPTLANALLWAFCGMSLYFIVWVIIDSFIRVDEINTRHHRFIYPDKQNSKAFIFTVVGQLCLRFFSGLAFIAWIFLIFKLVPATSGYFYKGGLNPGLLLAPFFLASYLFIGAILLRLTLLRPRVFSDSK